MAARVVDTAMAVRPAEATPTRSTRTTVVVLVAWVGVVVLAHFLLERLQAEGANIRINAAPLVGTFDLRLTGRILPAVALAAVVTVAGPTLVHYLRWHALLFVSTLGAALWAVALALVDGVQGLTAPLEARTEYLADVTRVGSPLAFLSTFVERLGDYSVHVQGHPPGMVLLLSALDRIALGGSGWAAALCIAGGAAAVPAVLVAVREVTGVASARRAAPFLVLAPAAIWVATSADAFFMGVSAWAVAIVVLATGRRGLRADVYALAGGVLFGATAFLSYGLVLLAIVPAVVAWQRRRLRLIALAAIGAAPVFLAFLAAGFWWVAGLVATRERYLAGVGSRRPYLDFLVANTACLAIVLGPAIVVALVRLRDRWMWLLVGGTLVVVAIAMISGMSKGEVERIWLPFAIWLLPAGAALVASRKGIASAWLGVQAATAIAIATVVKTSW